MAKSILVYTNHFYPENFKINEIVQDLDKKGYEIKVITCIPNYPSGQIFPEYGFFKNNKEKHGNLTIRRLPMIPRGSGSKIRMVLNYLSYFFSVFVYTQYLILFKKRYDCIFVHHTSPLFIAISPVFYKKLRRKTKLILWDLDIWPDTLKALDVIKSERTLNLIERIVVRIYKSYDEILVTSKSFVSIVRNRIPNVPVSYFPNWAEEVFTERIILTPDIRPKFNSNGLKIMFAGNIGDSQDIECIFNAIKMLKDENINWFFVGDGRMRQSLENLVLKENLAEKVTFYGNYQIAYMPYFFNNADVMLLSLKDKEVFKNTVPAKLQSYMAFEKPVLAMLSGEAAEIINESKCGWVTDSGNYNGLVKQILLVKKMSKEELKAIGKNGKNFFDLNFKKDLRMTQLIHTIEKTEAYHIN